jgi:hypothetical protein
MLTKFIKNLQTFLTSSLCRGAIKVNKKVYLEMHILHRDKAKVDKTCQVIHRLFRVNS